MQFNSLTLTDRLSAHSLLAAKTMALLVKLLKEITSWLNLLKNTRGFSFLLKPLNYSPFVSMRWYCWTLVTHLSFNNYSPEVNNCFSIITQVNIRENQRIDCQTLLFTLFPEIVRQWTATRADHMILQIDFTDKKWQTCARTNILRLSENKTGGNLPNKKLICFQFKQKS